MVPSDASHHVLEADRELRPILHEEIDRLPEGHRLPVVLCDLEGLTYEQAAEQLRWTVPTLRCRLAKARQKLKGRLARRGLAPLSAGPLVAPRSSPAIVPPALLKATVLAATKGTAASGGAALLTQAILRGMLMTKIKIASTALLSALALASAGVIASGSGKPDEAKEPAPAATDKPAKDANQGDLARVLDPDGKPAEGARIYRSNNIFRNLDRDPETVVQIAGTALDGSFRLSAEDATADEGKQQILAASEGYGPALALPSDPGGLKVLRLVADDVPILGRILDTDAKPVVGAKIQLVSILWHPSGKLDEWLAALEAEKVAYPVQYRLLRQWASNDLPSLYPPVTTDRDGRFTLRGVGRERVASLLISGPGIETRFEWAATRVMPDAKYPDFDRQNMGQQVTYHGASFDMVAGPGLDIVGTVTDKETGRGLAGVTVQNTAAFGNPLRLLKTTTDAEGRYQLRGLPPKTSFGDEQEILATRKDGPAYLPSSQNVRDGRGTITRDIQLKRGTWAMGRIIDKSTGKPVQANLSYYILADNPHLKEYPKYDTVRTATPYRSDDEGRYKIAVMPGRGVIGARLGNETYRLGMGVDKIPGLKLERGLIRTEPSLLIPTNYHTLVGIDPKPGDDSVSTDIELERGRTLKGALVGPGGEPMPGALMMGAEDHFQIWSQEPLPSGEFEVHSLGPDSKRALHFWHKEKNLAGAYVVQPGEVGPIAIKLQPSGTVTGRLVDDDGHPRARLQMTSYGMQKASDESYKHGSLPDAIKIDADGRFRATGLVPGLKYSMMVWNGKNMTGDAFVDFIAESSEVKDLGDIKVHPPKKMED